MSSTAEWRKLADDPFSGKHGSVSLTPVLEALRAACDRVDDLEHREGYGTAVAWGPGRPAWVDMLHAERDAFRKRAEAAEARVAELERWIAANHAGDQSARAEKAEAQLQAAAQAAEEAARRLGKVEIERDKACAKLDRLDEDACEERAGRQKAEARLKVAVDALSAWLSAYDSTVPDNGPALTEHECAEQARATLAKLRGEP